MDDALVQRIQCFIDAKTVGEEFELLNLVGNSWQGVTTSPTEFGTEFLQAVNAGRFRGIQFAYKRANNHAVYRRLV